MSAAWGVCVHRYTCRRSVSPQPPKNTQHHSTPRLASLWAQQRHQGSPRMLQSLTCSELSKTEGQARLTHSSGRATRSEMRRTPPLTLPARNTSARTCHTWRPIPFSAPLCSGAARHTPPGTSRLPRRGSRRPLDPGSRGCCCWLSSWQPRPTVSPQVLASNFKCSYVSSFNISFYNLFYG